MSVALVAGANGAIGRHTVATLKAANWVVAGVGHGALNWGGDASIDLWIAGDVSPENLDVVADRLGVPDVVINLAGGSAVGPSLAMPFGDFERTVATSMRLLNWMWTSAPLARFVAVSSAAVYGDNYLSPIEEDAPPRPLSPYGHHKLMMEQAVRYWGKLFGIHSVIARPFSVYGVGLQKQLVFDLCKRMSSAPTTMILSGTGQELRDWIGIADTARLLVELANFASQEVPAYNLCTGEGHTVSDIAHLLAHAWGADTKIEFDGVSRVGDPTYLVGSAKRLNSIGLSHKTSLHSGIEGVVTAARSVLGNMRS